MTTLVCPREFAPDALHQSVCLAVSRAIKRRHLGRFHLHLQLDNEEGSCRLVRELRFVKPLDGFIAANSIAWAFQQVSSIFSFDLRSITAKPVEVELPQLMQITIDRAECRNYFRHAGYGVDMIGLCSNGVLSA